MNFTISYKEVADIGNYFLHQDQDENKTDLILFEERNGLSLLIKNIDIAFFKLKRKIRLGLVDYSNDQVVIKVYSSNFISGLIKRIILRIGYKIILKEIEDPENEILNPEDIINIRGSYIYLKINNLLKGNEVPFEIVNIKNYGHKLEVEGAARIPVS